MIGGRVLSLKDREPVDVSAPGPTQTNVVALRNASNRMIWVRGDDDLPDGGHLGFPIPPGESLTGIDLGTSERLFVVAAGPAEVHVLTRWTG